MSDDLCRDAAGTRRERLLLAVLAFALALSIAPARADDDPQNWPTRTVKIVNPLAPGGGVDILVRAVADELTANLKEPFVVENRPGGGGSVAALSVAHAPPDGYTLFHASVGPLNVTPLITKNVGYDPVRDFTPVTQAVEAPIALVVNTSLLPVHDVGEFIAYAKLHPGQLSYGSSGRGSIQHLAGEYLKVTTGIQMVHIPYRGGNPAMTDLLAGQVPVLFASLSSALPYLAGGKIKVLGVVEAHRSRSHPEIPTIGETVPRYALPPSWLGFVGPAGMPAPLVNRIYAELVKTINTPRVRKILEDASFEVAPSASPAEFSTFIAESLDRYRKIVAAAHLEPQ